jgi:membrane protein
MLLLTLAVLVLAALSIALLVLTGPVAEAVGNALGMGNAALTAWNIAKWPVLLLFAIVLVALLFHFTPNVRQPKFRWISIGAAGALVALGLATVGFFFYVSNFGNYNRTYGSIGGMIVLLLWLWIGTLALLFGAEFDAEMERGRQLQGGIAAQEELQLPPRDTRGSRKRQEKLRRDIAAGEHLREQAGPDDTSG